MTSRRKISVFFFSILFMGVAFGLALMISPTINNLIETTFGAMTGCDCLCTYCAVGTLSNTAGDTCDSCGADADNDDDNCDVIPALGINECDPANPSYCPSDCAVEQCCGSGTCDSGFSNGDKDMNNCCHDCNQSGGNVNGPTYWGIVALDGTDTFSECSGLTYFDDYWCSDDDGDGTHTNFKRGGGADCSTGDDLGDGNSHCVGGSGDIYHTGQNSGHVVVGNCSAPGGCGDDRATSSCNDGCCNDCMGSSGGSCYADGANTYCLESGTNLPSDEPPSKRIDDNNNEMCGSSFKEIEDADGWYNDGKWYWRVGWHGEHRPRDWCSNFEQKDHFPFAFGKGTIKIDPTGETFDVCNSNNNNPDDDGFTLCDGNIHYHFECKENGPDCICTDDPPDENGGEPYKLPYSENCNDYDGWYYTGGGNLEGRDYSCGWNSLTDRGCIFDPAAVTTENAGAECYSCVPACAGTHTCDSDTGIISWEECIHGGCVIKTIDCSRDCANQECIDTHCGDYGYEHEFKRGDPPLGWDFCGDHKDNDCDSNIDKDDIDCRHGGLVPCGRRDDDASTDIDETAPCGICHTFLTVKKVSDFVTGTIIFPLMSLLVLFGGGFWLTSGGDPSKISRGKDILKVAAIGFAIAAGAWMIANLIMVFVSQNSMGEVFGSPWHEINCVVPSCNLDNICESTRGECLYTPEVCDNCNNDAQCKNDGFCNPVFGDDPDCD